MATSTFVALLVAALAIVYGYNSNRLASCPTCPVCTASLATAIPSAELKSFAGPLGEAPPDPNAFLGRRDAVKHTYSTPNADLSDDVITIIVHRNGGNNTGTVEANKAGVEVEVVPSEDTVETVVAVASRPLEYVYPVGLLALYNSLGREVEDVQGLADGAVYYLVRRDNFFFWPGVRLGHKTVLEGYQPHADGSPMVMETISMRPRAFFIPDYLSEEMLTSIVNEANATGLLRSKVYAGPAHEAEGGLLDDVRTSTQTWLYHDELAFVKDLAEQISDLIKVPVPLAETALQVIHYDENQRYEAHHDTFNPDDFPDRRDLQRGRNRMITTFFYLSDVDEGGETAFPRAGPDGYGDSVIYDYKDCSRGMRVVPRRRGMLVFYSLDVDGHMSGAIDDWSLHGGCDVKKGQKTAANYWWYNQPL